MARSAMVTWEKFGDERRKGSASGRLPAAMVPVMVANRWVGFIGFDSCRSERLWQRYEIDLLTTIAGDLGRSLEQWETKRALQTKEVHYESVVEVLAEGVIVADQRGRFTRSNANASRILGLSAAQLQNAALNSNGWDVIREDGSRMPNHDFPAIRTLQNGEPCTGTIMGVRRPDGGAAPRRELLPAALPQPG